jgi:hypothetical protein
VEKSTIKAGVLISPDRNGKLLKARLLVFMFVKATKGSS